jgi:transposase
MSANFRDIDRNTRYLFPESIDEWLPEDHLARFVVEIVDNLDIANIEGAYRGVGIAPYHPRMLLALIFYGYATGVFSSRKIEHATYDSVPFRYIAVNGHPDHDTISNFRKRFLPEIEAFFTQLLLIANRAGCLKLGTVSLDGTKIHASASKHSAYSYEHACSIETRLRGEVEKLLKMAEEADNTPIPDGMDIPEELSRREDRLAVIRAAKAEIERRALGRFEEEKKEYEEKAAARAKLEKETGKKARGKAPAEPSNSAPGAKDQVNLTDPDSRIMRESGGSFEQSYNAQASADAETQLIVASDVTQNANDKNELLPALESTEALPEGLPKVERILADAGYYSEANVNACVDAGITPFIAPGRTPHNPDIMEDVIESESEVARTAAEIMKERLKTKEGRKIFSRRKCTIEPVFGIIKHVMGFRQFLLRGMKSVRGEWRLVCMSWNIKRLHKIMNEKGFQMI